MRHPPYHLLSNLQPPHSSDVKAVLAIGSDLLASASRDSTVAVWKRQSSEETNDPRQPLQLQALLGGHDAYVNSLAHIPGKDEDVGLLVSGGNSSLILLHSLDTLAPDAQHCLIGHALNVCALAFNPKLGKLLSGSWDCSARVWSQTQDGWACDAVLEGHEQAVWDVQAVDDGRYYGSYLTGSADNTIRLWSATGEQLQRFKGSPEPVRSLAMLPGGDEFASACNDGIIRIWDMSGNILATLEGHSDYVYQVRYSPTGHLFSCGEDHTLRVWNRQGQQERVLKHPCTTVWTVTSFLDGLVVTGGSDGVVRVWDYSAESSSQDETGPQPTESNITNGAQDVSQPVDNPKTDVTPSQVQRLVINIDLADDQPTVPLVFQSDQDPHEAAIAFGQQHGLSQSYIDRIEEFVANHVGGTHEGQDR